MGNIFIVIPLQHSVWNEFVRLDLSTKGKLYLKATEVFGFCVKMLFQGI